MNTQQIIVIVMLSVGLLINANLHGKPKKGNHNFWVSLINVIITLLLLYWGNFFN